MAEPAKAAEQDQSMEEILQSIKRIIADEGEPASAEDAAKPAPFGSDVLELTDMVSDAPAAPIDPIDAIMALTPAPVPPEPEPAPAPVSEPVTAAPTPPAPARSAQDDIDALLSEAAITASAEALRSLAPAATPPAPATPSTLAFRNGQTIEDLVLEAMRPLLKEWLDANLPHIVERKVQREIERIHARTGA